MTVLFRAGSKNRFELLGVSSAPPVGEALEATTGIEPVCTDLQSVRIS